MPMKKKTAVNAAMGRTGAGIKYLVLRAEGNVFHQIGWYPTQAAAIASVNLILKKDDFALETFSVICGSPLALTVALVDSATPVLGKGAVKTTGRRGRPPGRSPSTGAQAQA